MDSRYHDEQEINLRYITLDEYRTLPVATTEYRAHRPRIGKDGRQTYMSEKDFLNRKFSFLAHQQLRLI